jgi:hypothetical protein
MAVGRRELTVRESEREGGRDLGSSRCSAQHTAISSNTLASASMAALEEERWPVREKEGADLGRGGC